MSDLVVGELRGFRAWRLIGDGDLASVSMLHRWESATDEAACRLPHEVGDHPAPSMDCTCGLYAYYRPTTVPPSPSGQEVFEEVFGVVAVAGRVILATRGMRAERMTILALVTDDATLGERYGVPIYPSRKALLAVYPPQGYGELVDVDPTDPPWPATGGPSGFVAGMRNAVRQMVATAALAVMARIVAAETGVTVAEAGRAIQRLSPDELAEWIDQELELRRASHTGPATHGPRRFARRR